MYNIRHNNLLTFIGACVDSGNIAVLSEVCPRGSLMVSGSKKMQFISAMNHFVSNKGKKSVVALNSCACCVQRLQNT